MSSKTSSSRRIFAGIVVRNVKNLFEYGKEEEYYYKPVRVNNFWSSNYYIEYKSNSDKTKILSVEEYFIILDHI